MDDRNAEDKHVEEPEPRSDDEETSGAREASSGGDAEGVTVRDRRFWSPEADEEGRRAPRSSPYPSFVEELQAVIAEKERALDEVRRGAGKMRDEQLSKVRRLERDLQNRIDREVGDTLEELLEVIDHLDLAIQAGEQTEDIGSLVEGVSMVRQAFLQKLSRIGMERIEMVGKPFDPELAQAMGVEEVEEPERDNVVVEENRPGYRFRDRLLRPATVVVGRHAGNGPDRAARPEDESEETAVEPLQEEDSGEAAAAEAGADPQAHPEETGDPANEEGVDTWLETGELPPPSGAEPEDYRPIRPPHPVGEEERRQAGEDAQEDGESRGDEADGEEPSDEEEASRGPMISPAEVDFDDEPDPPEDPEDLSWDR